MAESPSKRRDAVRPQKRRPGGVFCGVAQFQRLGPVAGNGARLRTRSLAVDRLGSSPGGGGGAAAEALWAGTSSARSGPAGCLEAALAVQSRRRGRARRRADVFRPVVGRRLRFRCSRGTAGGFAVSGGRAGPFMGDSEASQRQGSWRARRCPGRVSLSSSGGGLRLVSLQMRQQDVRSRGSSGADAAVVARHLLRRRRPVS